MSSNPPLSNNKDDELSALYALDMLEPQERDWVRQSISRSHDFAQTVDELSDAAAAIAYTLPEMPMAANLKERLFERISQDVIEADSELYQLLQLSIDELMRKSQSLSWETLAGGTTDAQMAILEVDKAHQKLAFYVQANSGGHFPLHAHDSGETVLVLAGDFVVDGLTHTVGDRVDSVGDTAHQPETMNGCLLFCISSLNDEILS
ncbi:MAG: cupin domain-containing protein [Cyanobacteria bacterium P01_F01_bin.143]